MVRVEKLNQSNLIKEIRQEQRLSPLFPDESIANFIREGMQDINNVVGIEVDYDTDLEARSLLKYYVLYANHMRLAEFREVYAGEYVKLQIKYLNSTDIS